MTDTATISNRNATVQMNGVQSHILTESAMMNGDDSDIVQEGWLSRKKTYLNAKSIWSERYYILKSDKTISYYYNRGDVKPRGIYQLHRNCIVSDVKELVRSKTTSTDGGGTGTASSIINAATSPTSMIKKGKKIVMGKGSSTGVNTSMSTTATNNTLSDQTIRYCIKIMWPDSSFVHDAETIEDVPEIAPLEPPTPKESKKSKIMKKLTSSKPAAVSRARSSPVLALDSEEFQTNDLQQQPPSSSRSLHAEPLPTKSDPNISLHDKLLLGSSLEDEEDRNDGVTRHYEKQMEQQALQSQYQEEMYLLQELAAKKAGKRNKYKLIMQGSGVATAAGVCLTATVLSFGVGLVPVLMFGAMSAVAGGGGAMAGRGYMKNTVKSTTLFLSSSSLEEITTWKVALEEAIQDGVQPESCTRDVDAIPMASSGLHSNQLSQATKITTALLNSKNSDEHEQQTTRWKPLEPGITVLLACGGTQGLRIFLEEKDLHQPSRKRPIHSVIGEPCPAVKAHLVLPASPLNAFMRVMTYSRLDSAILTPNSEQRASFRVIETMNDHMDVIHLVFRPLYLFPSWSAPRDYCLFRYWRYDDDGSYMICYDSVQHRECPVNDLYVRGELHGVITIAPKKKAGGTIGEQKFNGTTNEGSTSTRSSSQSECLVNYIVQVDPKGWIPTFSPLFSAYVETFAVNTLLQLLDIRDALDHERFFAVSVDDIHPKVQDAMKLFPAKNLIRDGDESQHDTTQEDDAMTDRLVNYDFSYVDREISKRASKLSSTMNVSKKYTCHTFSTVLDSLYTNMWAEPDANSFMVRGKKYKSDKKKIHAGSPAFRLICVDMIHVNAPIMTGLCSHPRERMQLTMKTLKEQGPNDTPPFIFVVNIVLPGPPSYHLVMYYCVNDMSSIDGTDGTEFSKLASQFFFGDSDEFRDNTFKLIPCVVEGNFLVRKACGTTPAIMGTKLKQHYFRGENYFELLLDVGSSAVSTGVVRLCIGYAKAFVCDIAFLLEGNDESTLPEKVLGCCRLKNVDYSKKMRFCASYDDYDF